MRRGARSSAKATTTLPGTRALRWFIHPAGKTIGPAPAAAGAASYLSEDGRSDAGAMLRCVSAPLAADLELIGPLRLRLRIACSAPDADLDVALREWRADGSEVTAQGAQDPALPVALAGCAPRCARPICREHRVPRVAHLRRARRWQRAWRSTLT